MEVAIHGMLERERELSLLHDALDDTLSSKGRIVLITGEAGIGKTTLVRAFAEEARARVRVVVGTCDALLTPRPLGPVCDIAQDIGGPLLDAVNPDAERGRMFGALLTELRARPTLAVLEDVHWADAATLDTITYLGGRLEEVPCLLVASYRDSELGPRHPLRIVVGELPSSLTGRIALSPLSEEAVAELAGGSDWIPRELHAVTGGNPFFVTEALATGAGGAIPGTVRDAVLARAARVSEPGHRLLEAVAVTPGVTELWLLQRLASDEVRHLDECLATGMLASTGGGVGFRHELARLVIEECLPPDRRIWLHRAAIEALADPSIGAPDLAALAHHAGAARDGSAVLRFAPAAAERASQLGAHSEAADHYERALQFADMLESASQADLYAALAHEYYLTGDFHETIAASTRALERYRALGDVLKEGASLHTLSRIYWSLGRTQEAGDTLRRAVSQLESLGPTRELARAYAELSTLGLTADDFTMVATWSTRAIDLAQRLSDPATEAFVRVNMSAVEYMRAAPGGRERLEEELELALLAELEEVAAWAFTMLVRTAVRSREYDVADRYLEPGFEYCRDRELGNFRQGLGAERARRLLDGGDWASSTDAANLVLSTARTTGLAPLIALTTLGQVRARRGDPDVWSPLDRALAAATPGDELRRLALVGAARAEAAWLEGDLRRACTEATAAFQLALQKRHAWHAGELACWLKRGGELDGTPEWIAEPYACQIAGEWECAARFWRAHGCPYEEALALSEAGEEQALHRALALCQQLEARPLSMIVARRLHDLGAAIPRGPRPTTRANPANLTVREAEVLALVAEGLRNAEIAQQLVLSPRTVDHHVSAILRKLGAHTRGEAVATGVRLGLLQDR